MRILPAAFRGCDRARDGESEQRADQRRPVAKTHIGRRSGVALGGYLEPACGELRQLREHAPVAVDRGGDAAVGGGQVHASGLERAQARDLQVLEGASESPNHATLETLTSKVASGSERAISSPKASS